MYLKATDRIFKTSKSIFRAPPINQRASGKSPKRLAPQFSHLQNGNSDHFCPIGLYKKCGAQRTDGKCPAGTRLFSRRQFL